MGVRLREKPDGWYLVIKVKGKKRFSRKAGSYAAAVEAKEQLEAALTLQKSGFGPAVNFDRSADAIPTVAEYYKRFHDSYISTLAAKTREGYAGSFGRHILPVIGHMKLTEVTREDVGLLVGRLLKAPVKVSKKPEAEPRAGYTKDTIYSILSNLRTMFNYAMDNDIPIRRNPANKFQKLITNARVMHEEIRVLSPDDVVLYLKTIRLHFPDVYALFVTLIHTGMRSGEAAALRWSNIDFQKKQIHVRKSANGRNVGRTKTKKSRPVDMSDFLIETLQVWQKLQAVKYKNTQDWVFNSPRGKRVDMKNIYNRKHLKALKISGLNHMRVHDLRHTFASLLAAAGTSLAYVQQQLGHETIVLTANLYTHALPGSNREAVNSLPVYRDECEKQIDQGAPEAQRRTFVSQSHRGETSQSENSEIPAKLFN